MDYLEKLGIDESQIISNNFPSAGFQMTRQVDANETRLPVIMIPPIYMFLFTRR